jgi:hypothetical protein
MGLCVATCSDLLDEVTMPKIAEALVMHQDLSLVDDEGFSKVMVVSIHLLFFFFDGHRGGAKSPPEFSLLYIYGQGQNALG